MSILQEKNLSLHRFDLCPAMDLVAFLTHEGFICVHRTISWERVYVRKIEEVVQEKSDQPLTVTALKFSLDGKFLALGFSSGLVVLIDIEFSVTFQKTLASPVSSVTWQRFPVTSSKRSDVAESLELDELFEQESNDSHRPDDRQRCLRLLADSLLFVFLSDLTMVVLSYGVEIVYLTSLQSLLKLPTPPHHLALTPHLLSLSQQRRLVLSMSLTPSSAPDVIAASPSSSQRFLRHVEQLRRLSYISLLTSAHLRQLEEVVAGMARRWRECVKTIPAKISLLTSLLQGYELRLTPVEFLHSLTLCGLWHPAALTSFSSHWNEQGIVRMRASVDSTTKHVIRCLQFKILPALTSLFLLATEYVAICSLLRGEDEEATSEYRERLAYRESAWQSFSLEIVSLFLAYDRTLHEAKYVREAMLSFFQFVRDCFQEATSSSASSGDGVTPAASHTVDYVIREKCGVFFSPMSNRPAIQNAEYVTGSRLFAHLSFEGVTPAPPLRSCAPSDPNPDVIVQERISREKEALLQSLTHDLQQAFTTSEEVEGVSSEQAQLFLQHILASSTSSSSSLLFGQQVKKTVQLYAKSIEPFPLDLFTTAYDATSSPPTSFSTSSMSLASRVQSQRTTVLMTHFPFREEGVGLSRVRSDFALLRVCLSETSDVILQLLEKDAQRNEMRFAARVSLRHDSPDKQLKGVQLFLYDRTSSPSSEAQANEAEQQMRHFQVVVLEEVQGVQGEDRKLTVRKFSLADVTFTRLKGNETSEEVQKVVLVPASVTSEVLLHASCERVEGDVSSGRGILLLQQIPFSPTILSRVHVIDLEAEEEEDDEGEDEEEEVEEEEEEEEDV